MTEPEQPKIEVETAIEAVEPEVSVDTNIKLIDNTDLPPAEAPKADREESFKLDGGIVHTVRY
ncbi:hypothetical protein [Sphingomonas sp. J315]|uniref:hypothetical protein n=1 Tax=Sphingomonas sp. J315 TaxID=2898433 RepID=UPI0021AD63BE|nr:hypothetical protein [Sphingomonas sp. J315]UUY00981.1 hypothetical protein LRS08_07975 [Sphingomonas sp. J315]